MRGCQDGCVGIESTGDVPAEHVRASSEILCLDDDAPAGRYEVLTRSGARYFVEIDPDRATTVTRLPSGETLYRDLRPLLVHHIAFRVGAEGRIVFSKDAGDAPEEYAGTVRATTVVTSIRRVVFSD